MLGEYKFLQARLFSGGGGDGFVAVVGVVGQELGAEAGAVEVQVDFGRGYRFVA